MAASRKRNRGSASRQSDVPMPDAGPPKNLWVLLGPHPIKVPTQGCKDVYDVIKAVKKELAPKLDNVAVDDISLHVSDCSPALDPGLELSGLATQPGYTGNSSKSPLLVNVASAGSGPVAESLITVESKLKKMINDFEERLSIQRPSSNTLPVPSFYKNIGAAKYNDGDGFITFADDIPSVSTRNILKRLFVRSSYRVIAKSIKSGLNKTIVTGTPGVGKSLFLIYFLWKLVVEGKEDKPRVLLFYHPNIIYFDGQGGVVRFDENDVKARTYDPSFWNKELYCLFDSKGKEKADLKWLPFDDCTFILATSPRSDLVNDFQKTATDTFYMPTWTYDELQAIAQYFPAAENVWRDRYRFLGGVPRHVLEKTEDDPATMLDQGCATGSLKDLIRTVGPNLTITSHSKVIHRLIHIASSDEYTKSSVCFASDIAMNKVFHLMKAEIAKKMYEFLQYSLGNPCTATLCGRILEPHAILKLKDGGQFTCRRLYPKMCPKPADMLLNIPASSSIETAEKVEKVDHGQKRDQLYKPRAKNYPGIDAWMHGIGAFQMTVAMQHDINESATNDFSILGGKLYWVVPEQNYASFDEQATKLNIEQYVIMFKYPNRVPTTKAD